MHSDRLCYFLPSLDGGGAEHCFLDLANWMARSGRKVSFLLGQAHGQWLEHLDPSVEVVDLGSRRVLACIAPLRRYLARENPKAIMSSMTHANLALILAGRVLSRYQGKILVHEVNSLDDTRVKAYGPRERHFIALSRYFYPMADCVVAVSKSIAAEITENQRSRPVNLIYHPLGVDLDLVRTSAGEQIEHPWLSDKRTPVLTALGRLGPEKGFDTLIKALALARRDRDMKLIILGEGSSRPQLEGLIKQLGLEGQVELPGFVKNPFGFLARSDLFVLSSLAEGFSLALAEALACGCNVVTTSCSEEPLSMVEQGRFGSVVPVGDPEAMARAILARLDNPLPAEALKARAEPYDLNNVGASFLNLMKGGSCPDTRVRHDSGQPGPRLGV